MPDVLGPLRRWTDERTKRWPRIVPEMVFGRYALRERIPCGPDDECFVAVQTGPTGFERTMFLRRFEGQLDPPTVEAFKKRVMQMRAPGIEDVFELGRIDGQGFYLGELVDGESLADLVVADRVPLPWVAAVAILHDAWERIAVVESSGMHVDVTPARLRLSSRRQVTLCQGTPRASMSYERARAVAAVAALATAATPDERGLLADLLDDAASLSVISDALLEKHPELDPILPLLLSRERTAFARVAAIGAAATAAIWRRFGD